MPPKQNQPKNNNNNNNNNQQKNNNNNNNAQQKSTNPQPKKKEKKDPPQPQGKPEQTQAEVPPVVTAIRTKQDIQFISLPVQPSLWPSDGPERLKCTIKNPTSDIIWSQLGDRCAVCTTDGILVYNTPLTPGAEFTLTLHAILPYTTARFIQFSPLGNYLLSYETHTKSCGVNLFVWDLTQWNGNVHTPRPKNTSTPEDGGVEAQADGEKAEVPIQNSNGKHASVIFSFTQRTDLPSSPHSSVQWTDDEEYVFVLPETGTISCYSANNMTKPLTTLQQKRLSLFQLSKIPKAGDKTHQYVALFSPCIADEPAKCTIFKTLDIVRGKSIQSGGVPPKNAPMMPPTPIVWGPLKPCQQVAIFRTNSVIIQWHPASQALLLKTLYDDSSSQSYYGETRLYVVYVDKEAVAVSFGNDSKGDIHDAAWCPTSFEFATLHGPARDATCTIWHARDCSAVRSIGSGPFNVIRYNPSGRLLLVTGIGSLAGKIEIWDKKTLVRLYKGQDEDSPRTIIWSPCGRYFISATIFPYLRVGNQFKINRFDGKVLYQEAAKTSATTLSIASEKAPTSSITLAQQGPDNGHFLQVAPNYYPRTNIFTDVKLPQELLQSAQVQMKVEPTLPAAARYVPPHLRDANAAASPTPTPVQSSNTINGPRDFAKEKKLGIGATLADNGNPNGFGAKPATQTSQLLHNQKLQQQQQQRQQNKADTGAYGSWRQ